MHKVSLYLLVMTQTALGLFNILLILHIFGNGATTDAYFLTGAVVSAMSLVQLLLVEQFLVFYNDIDAGQRQERAHFVGAVTALSLVSGGGIGVLLFLFAEPSIQLFAWTIATVTLNEAGVLLKEMLLMVLLFPLSHVLRSCLNAEGYFVHSFVAQLFPGLTVFGLLLLMVLGVVLVDIHHVAMAFSTGALLQAVVLLLISRRKGLLLGVYVWHEKIAAMLRNSTSIRVSHNVHNVMSSIVINNLLASYPQGALSTYHYAKRAVEAVSGAVFGAPQTVLAAKTSEFWSQGRYLDIAPLRRKFLVISGPLFVAVIMAAYIALPFMLEIVAPNLTGDVVAAIAFMLLLFAGWTLVIAFEAPYVAVLVAAKDAKAFMIVNSIFIAVFSLVAYAGTRQFGPEIIPVSAAMAQILSWYLYRRIATESLGRNADVMTGRSK